MAFAAGPVSFQRFYMSSGIGSDVTDAVVRTLNEHAFGRLAVLSDDTQIGWIGPRHLFDTEIGGESIAFGRFVHLALRLDKLKAPSNVLRAYVRMEEEAALQASGREFLSNGEKRRCREAAKERAEQEARSGGFRRMSMYPVLIDLEGEAVYLGNAGASLADRFMQLFSDTFGKHLEPAGPERVAYRLLSAHSQTRALENLPPSYFVRPPEGFAEAAAAEFGRGLEFLGKEFLTWLWFKTDQDDAPLRVAAGDEIVVAIEKSLRLKCDFGLTGTDAITADLPAGLPEARAALRVGKQPLKMGLVLGGPLGEFRLTLDGARLTVSGLQLPEDDSEQDLRARIEQRFELTTDAAALIDALYELFLLERTGSQWSATQRELSQWVRGAKEPAPRLHAATA